MSITKLVMLRHGESKWNRENIFTGWTDIELSEKGHLESKRAGRLLKEKGYFFDFAFTSFLKRAIHTLCNILNEMDQVWIPVKKSWKLNERHYGALQGFNKEKISKNFNDEQVIKCRRSLYDIPPSLNKDDKRFPGNNFRYFHVPINKLPVSESLSMTIDRIMPYWNKEVVKRIKSGKKIIIVAHGNSIRAILKFIDNLNEKNIMSLNIPTGMPLIYEFDDNMKVSNRYYLDDL